VATTLPFPVLADSRILISRTAFPLTTQLSEAWAYGAFLRRARSGINQSFVKEVQIKTGGFEPQYGHASGGIVQIVTKSGSTKTHGEIGGYFHPLGMQITHSMPTTHNSVTANKFGRYLGNANYEGDAELGGYVPVPRLRNHLFYFGNFNPSFNISTSHQPSVGPIFRL